MSPAECARPGKTKMNKRTKPSRSLPPELRVQCLGTGMKDNKLWCQSLSSHKSDNCCKERTWNHTHESSVRELDLFKEISEGFFKEVDNLVEV